MSEKFSKEWITEIQGAIADHAKHPEKPFVYFGECFDALTEIERLQEVIQDYRDDTAKVLNEKCPTDERHCGCVPILRQQINNYQKALVLIITATELSQAKTMAKKAIKESNKNTWNEESVGEYWVGQLEMLEDKYEYLEKNYEDVCQKRLNAADIFSKQIISLESSAASLRALVGEITAELNYWFEACTSGVLHPEVVERSKRVEAILSRAKEVTG